jgi:hypothetical protein
MMVRLSNPSWLFDICLLRLVSCGGIKRQGWSRLLSSERCITLHTVRVFRDLANKMPRARGVDPG